MWVPTATDAGSNPVGGVIDPLTLTTGPLDHSTGSVDPNTYPFTLTTGPRSLGRGGYNAPDGISTRVSLTMVAGPRPPGSYLTGPVKCEPQGGVHSI